MDEFQAFTSKYLFDGKNILKDKTVIVRDNIIEAILPAEAEFLSGKRQESWHKYCGNGILTAGFIDLQVNGCGGVAFNTDISNNTLETIYQTWLKFGTTGFLPTLITCGFSDIINALEVVKNWFLQYGNKRGVLGIHLEGPFISKIKHAIHPQEYIIPPQDSLLNQIVNYAKCFPIMMTIAIEEFSKEQIKFLLANNIILAIGHSNADYNAAIDGINLGIKAITHTFNAMNGLIAREPGVIGAALNSNVFTGLIADLIHVDIANIKLLTKIKPEKTYLVTDSVTPTGSNMVEFNFANKKLYVKDAKCLDVNGTLGGAMLTMNQAVEKCVNFCGVPLVTALQMATIIPAKVLGLDREIGKIEPGYKANFVHMDMKTFVCKVIN